VLTDGLRFALDPDLSLTKVAETLPFTFTGADLYALCSDAMLKAVTRAARAVDERVATINDERLSHGQNKISVANFFDHYAEDMDTQIAVTEADFTSARQELVPSVSVDELRHYERVRNAFEGAAKDPKQNGSSTASADRRSAMNQVPLTNGSRPHSQLADGGADNADDDFVIRTDRLSVSETKQTFPVSKGKGKGKNTALEPASGYADGDEDLYD
jgi:peroxin-6